MIVLYNSFYVLNQLLFTLQNSTQTTLCFSEVFLDSAKQVASSFTVGVEPLPSPISILEHPLYCVPDTGLYSKLPLYSHFTTQGQEKLENACGMNKSKKALHTRSYPASLRKSLFFRFPFIPFVI